MIAAAAAWLVVVVDQLDGDAALVEWDVGRFAWVDALHLPADTREGDRLCVATSGVLPTESETVPTIEPRSARVGWRRSARRPRGANAPCPRSRP